MRHRWWLYGRQDHLIVYAQSRNGLWQRHDYPEHITVRGSLVIYQKQDNNWDHHGPISGMYTTTEKMTLGTIWTVFTKWSPWPFVSKALDTQSHNGMWQRYTYTEHITVRGCIQQLKIMTLETIWTMFVIWSPWLIRHSLDTQRHNGLWRRYTYP